jgi:HAMP domain-containing protein
MGLAEVSSVLWRERELLEMLLFKLEEEQLVLASGRTKWLARATREVDVVLQEIKRTELARAVEVDGVAAELGLSSSPSLSALADAVAEPWAGLLREHRQAFLTMTAEIQALAQANRELLTTGQRAAREALLSLTDGTSTYTPGGAAVTVGTRHHLLDSAL